jgi:UDP-N-acetylglucosamine 3-dehydrogenase
VSTPGEGAAKDGRCSCHQRSARSGVQGSSSGTSPSRRHTSSAVAEREDIALLQFRTASGVLAHINTNWLTPFKARNVTVATRGKYVMGDLLTRQVTECFGFQPDGSYSMRHLSVGHAEPLRSELLAFLRAVRSGSAAAVTGEEGVASLEIAIRCLASRPVAVGSPKRQPPRVVAG